jgi:8-oxo-dGTP diphosphatase
MPPTRNRVGGISRSGGERMDVKAHIAAALVRDGDRLLLCHRSPRRRWYPDVWDMPGGHVEPGETPQAAVARELREELGIDVPVPAGPPLREVLGDTFFMQIWLFDEWTGSPVNAAPEEHDAIAWFTADALGDLALAHHSFLALFRGQLSDENQRTTAGTPSTSDPSWTKPL